MSDKNIIPLNELKTLPNCRLEFDYKTNELRMLDRDINKEKQSSDTIVVDTIYKDGFFSNL